MADPQITSLIGAVRQLTMAMSKAAAGGGLPGGAGGPLGGGPPGGKSLNELLSDNNSALGELIKTLQSSTKSQERSLLDHARKLEGFAAATTAIGNIIGQAVKYNITRPYELLGGQFGAVARPALEREKDFGSAITSGVALALLPFAPMLSGAVLGVGQMGLNQFLGRSLAQNASIKAGGLQAVASLTQEGILPARQGELLGFEARRLGGGAAGIGAQSFEAARLAGASIGMTAQQMAPLFAEALRVGGAEGLKSVDWSRVMTTAAQGIYGNAEQIAMGVSMGGRAGFGQSALEAASRRTGLTMDVVGQAAFAARTQTYLAGQGAGTRLFNMATNTQMARDIGIPAAMGAITQAAGGASAVAEGNEASEMLLYQQFRLANPGSSYMDFLEARRNKETDPRWLRTIAVASKGFAAQGQMGRITGAALGLAQRPSMVAGTAGLMEQALSGKLGELTRAGAPAEVAEGLQKVTAQEFVASTEGAAKFFSTYKDKINETSDSIVAATKSSGDFNETLKQMADIMDRLTITATGLVAEDAARWIGTWGGILSDRPTTNAK